MMTIWLADVETITTELITPVHDALVSKAFELTFDDHRLSIGIGQSAERPTVCVIKTIMNALAPLKFPDEAVLTWRFSAQSVALAELAALCAAWNIDADDVPVLSIIRLALGCCEHRTQGLAMFVGFECAVSFHEDQSARDAALNLALLARHALAAGGLDPNASYEGHDRQVLVIDWPDRTKGRDMVTIILPSVQNGLAFD
jgi:hypothetical protein